MSIARRYVVAGRVQGVGFRFFVQEAARREGVCGWVRNRGDGSVEAFGEGDAAALDRFERHLRAGPPASRVAHVNVTDEPFEARAGFEVRPSAC